MKIHFPAFEAMAKCNEHLNHGPIDIDLGGDVVVVVRCRECNQGEVDDPDFPDQYYCHAGCGWNKGDFYCAYGERKEGAGNG